MGWREGYFSFAEGPLTDVPAEAAVRIPTEAILMEGARRIDEWSRIEGRIPHLGVVPVLSPATEGGTGALDLLPPEWEVLALIDAARDIRAIAGELGRSDFDVAKILFGLESAGVISLADRGQARGGRPSGSELTELVARAEGALREKDWERARGAAEQAAVLQPHDPSVHLLLGRIHLAAGKNGDGVEELRRALRLDPLLAPAYRLLGYGLIALGRFAEALEQWTQWERLAEQSPEEAQQRDAVARAKAAAEVLAGTGTAHG
jgi:tetratricopeptide (TPR) repeat protein